MRKIFIAFYGWPVHKMEQKQLVYKTATSFECWDLKKINREDFIRIIKRRIRPLNKNILRNYRQEEGHLDYGVSEEQYKDCCWGLLLPDPAEHGDSCHQILNLLNLYSTSFLKPAFVVSDFGIRILNKKAIGNWLSTQKKSGLFKTKSFVLFYKKLLPQLQYFIWQRSCVLKWNEEDWKIFIANNFYTELEKYENSKSIFSWQRESAEMTMCLETLFTAGDSEREDIGYRLRKRIGILLGWKFPDIEKEIKNLYSDRSEFVHGSYYKKIKKLMRKNPHDSAMPVLPDFKKLYLLKERIRFLYVAYLYLNSILASSKESLFEGFNSTQDLLEQAIIDTNLRSRVLVHTKDIIDLLPESETGFYS